MRLREVLCLMSMSRRLCCTESMIFHQAVAKTNPPKRGLFETGSKSFTSVYLVQKATQGPLSDYWWDERGSNKGETRLPAINSPQSPGFSAENDSTGGTIQIHVQTSRRLCSSFFS